MSDLNRKVYIVVLILALLVSLFFILLYDNCYLSKPSSFTNTSEGGDSVNTTKIHSKENIDSIPNIVSKTTNDEAENIREAVNSTNIGQPLDSRWRILDDCNNPRAGVHVVCTPISPDIVQKWLDLVEKGEKPEPELSETFTSSNGCFDFPFLKPNLYLIRGDTPKWSPALGILDFRKGRPDEFSAIMAKEKTIRGKLLDCYQHPINDALVYCYLSPTYPIDKMPLDQAAEYALFDQQILTNEKGEFIFRGLYPSKNYDLYTEYEGCIPISKIVPNYDRSDQVLVLKKTCTLDGRITSYDGSSMHDAIIEYCQPQSPYSYFKIDIVDEEGHFHSDSVPEGFILLQGKHKNYGHDLVKVNLRSDRVNYAELKLPKGVKISIKITDEQDNPLKGILVTVNAQDSGALICSSLTDEEGKIIAYSLNKEMRNSIRTRDPNYKYSVYNKTHTFNENGELHIRLKKRIPVKVTVRDKSTNEIILNYNLCVCSFYKSSALREFDSLNICTFEYEMETPSHDVTIGEEEFYEITVLADGYMPKRVLAMLPTNESGEVKPIEIFLNPGSGCAVNGCVVDMKTSLPVSDALIQLYINGIYNKKPSFPLSIDRTTTTGKEGTFTLQGMPDHRFFLKVKAPGYAPAVVDSLELDLSAPAVNNRIQIERGGSLSGRVFNKNDSPLDQAYVQIRLTGTNELSTTRSNPDGSYYFYDLPPGEHIVSVWDILDNATSQNTMKLQKTVVIEPGKITNADFTFEGSCIIRGLCTVDGEEGSGIIINLFDENGVKTHSVEASSTGYYKIFGLTHGKYTLEAISTVIGAGGMIRRPITLQNGQDLTLDLEFKGKAVFGTVTDAEGQPIHAAEVELLTPSFQRDYLTYTDHEGNYAAFNVEEGDYFVVARAPGYGEEMKGPWMLGGKQKSGRRVDFALKAGGAVRMHVNDSQGNPIPNAKVLLSNNMSQGVLWTGKTKYSGIVVFDNLQTESLSALAICMGYAPAGTTFLAPADETTDAEIILTQGGSFNLTVKSKNGIPIPKALVVLTDFSIMGLSSVRLAKLGLLAPSDSGFLTDEKGGFSLGLLPPGNYGLQITKGSQAAQASVSITPGQETNIRVVLE